MSIVELMISIAVGIFCLAIISSIYIHIKKNFYSKESITSLTENQRNALINMSSIIQMAGFHHWSGPNFTIDNKFPEQGEFVNGQIISGGPSRISVRYKTSPNSDQQSCAGTGHTGGASDISINTYELNTSGELICTVNGSEKTIIASHILQFNVLFGVDLNGDGSVDTYSDGRGMSQHTWLQVRSVQLSMKFSSPGASKNSGSETSNQPIVQHIYLMGTHALQ